MIADAQDVTQVEGLAQPQALSVEGVSPTPAGVAKDVTGMSFVTLNALATPTDDVTGGAAGPKSNTCTQSDTGRHDVISPVDQVSSFSQCAVGGVNAAVEVSPTDAAALEAALQKKTCNVVGNSDLLVTAPIFPDTTLALITQMSPCSLALTASHPHASTANRCGMKRRRFKPTACLVFTTTDINADILGTATAGAIPLSGNTTHTQNESMFVIQPDRNDMNMLEKEDEDYMTVRDPE